MSSKMKTITLFLVAILAVIGAYNYFAKSNMSENTQQVEAQGNYEDQNRAYWEQMAKAREQSKRMDEQLEQSEKNQKRYDALLTRWESQAERMDKILEKLATK
jgi:uncharacterized protein (UPF0333 family)